MLAQLVQDFVHLERRENGFDEHGRLDRAAGNADELLRRLEHLVPKACFQMTLELRQIEVRTSTRASQRLVIVREIEREIEERRGHRFAIDRHMLLDQMPTAWPYDQCRGLRL